MAEKKMFFEGVEKISTEIELSLKRAESLKCELLKHYLLNYILYINNKTREDYDDEFNVIKDELLRISILLEKLVNMEKKIQVIDSRRVISDEMMKNRAKTKKPYKSSGKKFKDKFAKLQDKLNGQEEISKKSKSKKFN